MANMIPVGFFCPDCNQPLGISIKLIEECLANEYAEESLEEEVSETEIETFLMAKGIASPSTKMPVLVDPVGKIIYFPLWCDNCEHVKTAKISVTEILELSQTHKNNNHPEFN